MNVSDCMTVKIEIASPRQTLRDAAQAMRKNETGILPVGENDRLTGMITDRDMVVRAIAEGKGPETPIAEVMTAEVIYCFEDDDLDTAATKMSDSQVRRLPVLNRAKRLVGMISLGDLSQASNEEGQLSAEALTGIATPGGQHVQ
jgi:CBS domain-containing protein